MLPLLAVLGALPGFPPIYFPSSLSLESVRTLPPNKSIFKPAMASSAASSGPGGSQRQGGRKGRGFGPETAECPIPQEARKFHVSGHLQCHLPLGARI